MKLEDTALYQLSIVSQTSPKGTLFQTINKTCTQQGKRLLKKNLLAPLTKTEDIEYRYDMVNQFRKCNITHELKSLIDIEKYIHKWELNKISPHEFVILLYCFPTINKIIQNIHENTTFQYNYFNDFKELDKKVQSTFHFEQLEKYNTLSHIESNLFQKNVKPELDILQQKLDNLLNKVDIIIENLNEKDKSDKKQASIKFEKTAANDQWYLSTTAKRIESLNKVKALTQYTTRIKSQM